MGVYTVLGPLTSPGMAWPRERHKKDVEQSVM